MKNFSIGALIVVAGVFLLSAPCVMAQDGDAPVPKTGQTRSYATGDDGDLERGVAWPNPRFIDNGDGTINDNLTGLTWLKNANCFGLRTWSDALSDCNGLEDGECGLTDGSVAGIWRLPNRRELFSLTNGQYMNPALSNTAGTGWWKEGDPFTNVGPSYYWSSTTASSGSIYAWYLDMPYGKIEITEKAGSYFVLPVRGGQ
ncbi:MAG: DUF1566 domain-containing protein [bacterium]|nr:DUF1566 domain-containing protein [bacterium]